MAFPEKLFYSLEILAEVESFLYSEEMQQGYALAMKLARAILYAICCDEENEDEASVHVGKVH